jgi:amidase
MCRCAAVLGLAFSSPGRASDAPMHADIDTLAAAMASGRTSAEALTRGYLARIESLDKQGPALHAVIAVMPDAVEQARRLDAERKDGRVRGPLHGIPVLVKDNIETRESVPTTAGSLALVRNITQRDAPLVARLRDAGAVILGKTNLSQWANIRSSASTSGWSAVGGLVRNPHASPADQGLVRNACGSSSGSGAAMAAGLAAATVGTETDGSIVCPSSANGIVGFKPTVGLVSRRHVVPISPTQDTAGPMTGSVRDAALLLHAMAGSDAGDAATAQADAKRAALSAPLPPDALRGKRIGVMRDRLGTRADLITLFDRALEVMRGEGAIVVELADTKRGQDGIDEAELVVLLTEFEVALRAYLGGSPAPIDVRSLADVIAFNRREPRETAWFGQDLFERAAATKGLDDPAYRQALQTARRAARDSGIDRLMREHKLDALAAITAGPAWTSDLVNGDHYTGPSASQLPAVAGYPHLTVPMGRLQGLPVGLSLIGGPWQDAAILALGAGYERARGPLAPPPLATPSPGNR